MSQLSPKALLVEVVDSWQAPLRIDSSAASATTNLPPAPPLPGESCCAELHQLRLVVLSCFIYYYLLGFIHPRWLFGISETSTVQPQLVAHTVFFPWWFQTFSSFYPYLGK